MILVRHPLLRMLLLSLTVVATACAGATAGGGGGRGNPDRIVRAELDEVNSATNAYEAIQLIRPGWLRTRGVASFSGQPDPIVVYVDNVRYGEVGSLQSVNLDAVEAIERIDATSATQRWGTGHAGGVLAVTLRRGL